MKAVERGREGEDVGCVFLVKKGYRIAARNFLSRVGEVDIVAWDPDGVLVFCEVKAYGDGSFVSGYEAVTRTKLKKIRQTAEFYVVRFGIQDVMMRVDLIVVVGRWVRDHVLDIR